MVDHSSSTFDEALNYINSVLTVPQLKTVLRQFGLASSGRKADLQIRLTEYIQIGLRKNDGDRINKVHSALMDAFKGVPSSRSASSAARVISGTAAIGGYNRPTTPINSTRNWLNSITNPPMTYTDQVNSIVNGARSGTGVGSRSIGGPNSFAGYINNLSSYPSTANNSSSLISLIDNQLNFVPSPFYDLITRLHDPLIFQPPYSETSRRSTNFLVPEHLWQKIRNDEMQIYFVGVDYNLQSPNEPHHIHFPPGIDLMVNQVTLPASVTKGIRGKIGSTLPVNITEYVKKVHGLGKTRFTVDVTVTFLPKERDRPPDPYREKTFVMMTYLATPHSISELIEGIKKLQWISKESIKEMIIEDNQDEDIVATTTVHSLKDPVSYRRIELPIRSIMCKHIDCLDANTFFQLQLQGPTWRCSICSNVINYQDLRVDGYFKDILDNTDKNAEDVEILPDGTWIQKGITAMDLSDSEDSDDALADRVKRPKSFSVKSEPGGVTTALPRNRLEPEVITLSDSDDDMTDTEDPVTGNTSSYRPNTRVVEEDEDDLDNISRIYARNSLTGNSLLFGAVSEGVVLDNNIAITTGNEEEEPVSRTIERPQTPTSIPPQSTYGSPDPDDFDISLEDPLLNDSILFNKSDGRKGNDKITQFPTPKEKDVDGDGENSNGSADGGGLGGDTLVNVMVTTTTGTDADLAAATADVANTSTPEPTPVATPATDATRVMTNSHITVETADMMAQSSTIAAAVTLTNIPPIINDTITSLTANVSEDARQAVTALESLRSTFVPINRLQLSPQSQQQQLKQPIPSQHSFLSGGLERRSSNSGQSPISASSPQSQQQLPGLSQLSNEQQRLQTIFGVSGDSVRFGLGVDQSDNMHTGRLSSPMASNVNDRTFGGLGASSESRSRPSSSSPSYPYDIGSAGEALYVSSNGGQLPSSQSNIRVHGGNTQLNSYPHSPRVSISLSNRHQPISGTFPPRTQVPRGPRAEPMPVSQAEADNAVIDLTLSDSD